MGKESWAGPGTAGGFCAFPGSHWGVEREWCKIIHLTQPEKMNLKISDMNNSRESVLAWAGGEFPEPVRKGSALCWGLISSEGTTLSKQPQTQR